MNEINVLNEYGYLECESCFSEVLSEDSVPVVGYGVCCPDCADKIGEPGC